jgi:hypothetical protein
MVERLLCECPSLQTTLQTMLQTTTRSMALDAGADLDRA